MLCTVDESNRLFRIYKEAFIESTKLNNEIRVKTLEMQQFIDGSDKKAALKLEISEINKKIPEANFKLQLAAIDLDNFKTNVKIEIGIGLNDEDSNQD